MNQDKILLATDIDGTLLRSDKTISDYTKERIHQMLNLGHYFVIATGRPFHRIEQIIDDLAIKSNQNFCICFNGGLIMTTDGSKVIYECLLNDDDVVRLVDLSSALKISVMVYLKDVILVDQIPDAVSSLNKLNCVKIVDGGKAFLRNQTNVYKVIYIGSEAEIDLVKTKIPKEVYHQFNVTRSSANYLEITAKSISKGNGMIKLAEYLKVDTKNTIAVGDEENDISMIKAANLGCVVSNGNQELIKIADFVTKSNDEDGVGLLIDQFVLQKEEA